MAKPILGVRKCTEVITHQRRCQDGWEEWTRLRTGWCRGPYEKHSGSSGAFEAKGQMEKRDGDRSVKAGVR